MMKFFSNKAKHIWVTLIFSLSVFILFPLSVYTQNIDLNRFSFEDILLPLFLYSTIGFIFTSLLVLFLVKRLKFISLLLTALLVCLWVQGNFIKYNLGTLDGNAIDWNKYYNRIWIEILVWAVIFTFFIIFRKKLLKNIKSIAILLFILFLAPSIFTLVKESPNISEKVYLDYSAEFHFSEQNVIVIILDNFKTDVFKPILEKYPEYHDIFTDFIYYDDAVGGYSTTLPSVPLLLTGKYYQNNEPMNDYLDAIEDLTLPSQLKKLGYTIESYPYVPFFSSIYDNHTSTMLLKDQFSTATQQLMVSGIRYSPLLLKPLFVARYYSGTDYVHKDLVTFNARINEFTVTTNKPMFKLIHLSGAHYPYQLDSALNWNSSSYLEQAAGSLLPVKNLLSELKKAGVYDNSMILIISDHGGFYAQGYSSFPLESQSQPLLLSKTAGQQFEQMQISHAPVTLGDIPKTIALETGIEANYPGYSIYDKIPENRIRYFYYYAWDQENWSTKFMPTLYAFKLEGPARYKSSWEYIGQYGEGHFVDAATLNESDLVNILLNK